MIEQELRVLRLIAATGDALPGITASQLVQASRGWGTELRLWSAQAAAAMCRRLADRGYIRPERYGRLTYYKITSMGRGYLSVPDPDEKAAPPEGAVPGTGDDRYLYLWDLPRRGSGIQLGLSKSGRLHLVVDGKNRAVLNSTPEGLYPVLEEAAAQQARVVRALHPSGRRLKLLKLLAKAPRTQSGITSVMTADDPAEHVRFISRELASMEEDGLATGANRLWAITTKGRLTLGGQPVTAGAEVDPGTGCAHCGA
jgi:hypothetical protein